MKKLVCLLVLASSAFAANGSFAGQVVNGPNMDANRKWVFIQGPRGPARRVDVSGAKVTFVEGVKTKNKDTKAKDAIREGAEVRVTASQDGDGEWKASAVEIVKLAPR